MTSIEVTARATTQVRGPLQESRFTRFNNKYSRILEVIGTRKKWHLKKLEKRLKSGVKKNSASVLSHPPPPPSPSSRASLGRRSSAFTHKINDKLPGTPLINPAQDVAISHGHQLEASAVYSASVPRDDMVTPCKFTALMPC
jgi:hypothetical protein